MANVNLEAARLLRRAAVSLLVDDAGSAEHLLETIRKTEYDVHGEVRRKFYRMLRAKRLLLLGAMQEGDRQDMEYVGNEIEGLADHMYYAAEEE